MENSITQTYYIGGMSCGGCVANVKNKLSLVQGVTSGFSQCPGTFLCQQTKTHLLIF